MESKSLRSERSKAAGADRLDKQVKQFGRAQRVDAIVRYLEAALLPVLAEFGRALASECPGLRAETISRRDIPDQYWLDLTCYPAGGIAPGGRAVSLVVAVIADRRLVLQANVVWDGFLGPIEGKPAGCADPGPQELGEFCDRVVGLLGPLKAAAVRGSPRRRF
jgi:hypothetical protein